MCKWRITYSEVFEAEFAPEANRGAETTNACADDDDTLILWDFDHCELKKRR